VLLLESHVDCPPQCVRATGSRRVCLRYVKLVAFPEPLGPGESIQEDLAPPPEVPTVHQCVPVHVIGDSPYGQTVMHSHHSNSFISSHNYEKFKNLKRTI